jgi:ABC-type amino acid transport substrate-binding protein
MAVADVNSERSNSSASADSVDRMMAILVARLNITSVSDLTGKTIAIDDTFTASSGKIRTAIVAAGATEVQLTGGSTIAIDRLMNGEVPAAIVALVPPTSAETFPDIDGFRVFRVPLSPLSLNERP